VSHKILVVDDNEANVIFLSEILQHEDYHVLAAYNGQQALELVQKEAPSIILLDVMMPEMDGFEVCRRLKANEATRHIAVIFITALDESEHVVNGFAVGGVAYVSKPFNINEIVARINTQLQLIQ
jgi:DNA-binding response OmpR family regulator